MIIDDEDTAKIPTVNAEADKFPEKLCNMMHWNTKLLPKLYISEIFPSFFPKLFNELEV